MKTKDKVIWTLIYINTFIVVFILIASLAIGASGVLSESIALGLITFNTALIGAIHISKKKGSE